MDRCPHNRPSVLCEACADAEVAKHKRFWDARYKSMESVMNEQSVFRVVEGVLQKAVQWVEVGIAEIEAEADAAAKALEAAAAHNALVQSSLVEARDKLGLLPTEETAPAAPADASVEPPLPASATPAVTPGAVPPEQREGF